MPGAFAAKSAAALVVTGLAGAAFAILLALVEAEWRPLGSADEAVVEAVNSLVGSSEILPTTAKVITQLGSPLAVGIVITVPVMWLLIRRLPRLAAYVAVSGLGAAVLGPGVKALVERARPVVEVPLSAPTGASFPSGHAIAITIAWGALLLVFLPVVPQRGRPVAILAVVALVVLVGLTRVALAVHYPSDVIAGWLLGGLWLTATGLAFRSSRELEGLGRPAAGVDAVAPDERRALHPAPAHDRPLPDGWSTGAKLVVAAVVLCGAVIGAGLLVTGPLGWVRRVDAEVVAWFAALPSTTLTDVVLAVAWLAGVAGSVAVLAIAVPLASAVTRRWSPPLLLLVGTAGQALIYLAASRIVGRDRPGPDYGELITAVSFPSGHVGSAVCTFGGIALLVVAWSGGRGRWAAVAAAVLLVLTVVFSRLYRGVHYPSDVLAGVLYGLVWLALCWRWLEPVAGRCGHEAAGAPPPSMRGGVRAHLGVALAAAGTLARVLRARQLARSRTGAPPGVRTDDGVVLHTEVTGREEAPLTVVMVHGLAASLEFLGPQRRALSERARVVAYDQRGHGRSGWRGPRSATIDRLGRDLGCVIEAVACQGRVVVVGHSLGGMAVLALARRRPDLIGTRVAGVAVISTSAGRLAQLALPPAAARIAVRSGLATASLWLFWALAPLLDVTRPLRTRPGRRWLRSRAFGDAPVPEAAVARAEAMWRDMPHALAAALYPAMVAYDAEDALDALAGVPSVVLTGTEDRIIPPRHSERIARRLGPRARLVTVPHAGHMVPRTHPDVVNRALIGLLDRVRPLSVAS